MQTIDETRRVRLGMLKKKYGKWADINSKLDWVRTSARLSQIYNKTRRKGRDTYYVMGDPTAREIEEKLGLPTGWMDTPPSYAELHGEKDHRAQIMAVVEDIPREEWPTALRLLVALKNPAT
jgi:hypothetical protein